MMNLGVSRKVYDPNSYLGKKFGRLTILSICDHRSKDNRVMVRCLCDCGNERDVILKNIISGTSQSCGCYKKERASAAYCIDETGNKYGYIEVIKRSGITPEGKATWLCKCTRCGSDFVRSGKELRTTSSIACASCSNELAQYKMRKVHVGDIYGRLTVIGDAPPSKDGQLRYLCRCSCGEERIVWRSSLRSGLARSCGCLRNSYEVRSRMSASLMKIPYDQWKGFSYKTKSKRHHYDPEYRAWCKTVHDRDHWTCACCGRKSSKAEGVILQVHHLDCYADYPDKRYSMDNAVSLCKECHMPAYEGSFHYEYGTYHTTQEQYYEWISKKKSDRNIA